MKARSTHTLVGGGGFLAGLALSGTAYVYVFLVGLGVGALVVGVVYFGIRIGRRLFGRIDRALPDYTRGLYAGATEPPACATCGHPVSGRNRYCSETCREIAAERRMRQRVHAERMADYDQGGIPF